MRRILLVVFLVPFTITVTAQKVWVGIIKNGDVAESSWQVLDEQFNPVMSSTEYLKDDSIPFTLEANRRYLLDFSITSINKPDTILSRLYVNGEPVLLIKTDSGPGDHFYYFFTGIRQPVTKITGGSDATISEFPWQVYLESGNFLCGGSIIADNWVITAAHCTEDDSGNLIAASQMFVTVGANNPAAGEGKRYSVSQVIRHEKYDSNTLENDIALLKISQPISYTNATPIRLISRNDSAAGLTDPGVMSWVTGYGLIRVRPAAHPTTLQKVQLPIVSNAQASVVWSDIPVTDIMAGYLNGGKDACSGDSGGPMVVPVDSTYKLAGIVSWGSSSCSTYGAYTRVSTFESWISLKTGIEISYTPPVPTGDSIICPGVPTSNYTVGTIQGATSYEWVLQPTQAGTISASSGDAAVTWNQSYKGTAVIMLRVVHNNLISDWSQLFVHLARQTKLLSQSRDTVICANQSIVLSSTYEGYNLVYSWYKNDIFLKKGTSDLVDLNGADVSNSGVYSCSVTGSCGSGISDPITLTVYPVTAINSISPDQEVAYNGSVDLSVSAVGHDLTYQWKKDSVTMAGEDSPVLSLVNVNAGNSGLYRVSVEGTCGFVSSRSVYLYVKRQNYNGDPEVFIWPTHTSSSVNIAMSEADDYNVRVFGAAGNLMLAKDGCQYVTEIDFSGLARGLYIITVYNNNFRKSFKIIRE
jgi:secreted trypsin-like serine protease